MNFRPLLLSLALLLGAQFVSAQPAERYTEPADPHQAALSEWINVGAGLNASWASRDLHYARHKVPMTRLVQDTTVYAWRGERLGAAAPRLWMLPMAPPRL